MTIGFCLYALGYNTVCAQEESKWMEEWFSMLVVFFRTPLTTTTSPRAVRLAARMRPGPPWGVSALAGRLRYAGAVSSFVGLADPPA